MQKEAVIRGYELTTQQQEVLRREQLGKQWLWGAVRVSGELDLPRLQRAVQQLAATEEVLRSGFEVETAECEPAAVAELMAQWGRNEGVEQWGVKLLRVSDGQQVLGVRMSPLVGDRETVRQVLADVLAGYDHGQREMPRRLQYVDYGMWQQEVQEEEGPEGSAYWEQVRQRGEQRRELRLGLERSAGELNWLRHQVAVAPEVVERVRRVAVAEALSEQALLLSVWQLLLWRHTEAEVVEVETYFDGRKYEDLRDGLGRYGRYLPVSARLDGRLTFAQLIKRTDEVLKEHVEWQEHYVTDEASRVSIGFEYLNWSRTWAGAAVEWAWLEERVGGQKLKLRAECEESGLRVELEYDGGVLSETAAAWLSEQYVQLLSEVSGAPEQLLNEAVLVSAREREKVLSVWNPPVVVSNEGSVVQLFEAQVTERPEATAIVSSGEQLSYEELNQRANQLAHYLRAQGVGPEVVVGLCVERSVEMVVGLLGILKAGGAYLPLDPAYPRQRLEYMLSDAQVGLVLTQGRLLDELPAHWGQTIAIDDEWTRIAAESTVNPAPEHETKNLAYVMYTSGSTGQPKGVMITHGGLVNYLQYATATYPFAAGSGTPLHSTLSFDLTVTSLYGPLLVGGWIDVMSESRGLEEAWQERIGYGVVKLTPAHLRLLNDTEGSAERLRKWSKGVIVGGEALSWEQVRPWVSAGVRVFNEYGPTETVVGSCVYELQTGEEERGANGGVLIGRPIFETQMYVLDQWQQPAAVGVRGEIYIGGAGLARGYWERADLTAERFVPHPYSAGERLYRTGDEGRYLEDGTIEYLGRCDQQVKVRGYRIELGEIEAVLESYAGVRQAVVTVREDSAGDQRLVAYLVAADQAVDEIRTFVRDRLPSYMIPTRWVVLEKLPLTRNGKVDRERLPEPREADEREDHEEIYTPIEAMVADIWRRFLRVEKIEPHEDFFELGGHSLLGTQVVSRLREVFGVEVGLRRLFEEPTLRGFSYGIEEELRAGAGVTVPPLQPLGVAEREQLGGLLPLSFAQQRLWFLDQLEPGNPFYNSFKAVRLKGELNFEALERTLSEVVRRHEVLRTRFVNVGGEPRQEVLKAEAVSLPVMDLSELTEPERGVAALEAAMAEKREPFDLANGPMLRVKLLRLNDEDHVVLLTMHHIASDGWSMDVLTREVGALYDAYSHGGESPLPELPIQYADFAVWQRGWLQGEELKRQLSYWRRQLGGELPVLELPIDRERPAIPGYSGAQQTFRLSPEVSAGLKELSRREGVTLFMTLLAAFQTLLHRHSGQQEIVVGTPLAGRTYRETESLIGFFINQLPLRTDLSGEPTFVELMQRVKEVCLGAYAHQDMPFEKLVEELQPERDLSRSPLFQVTLGLQNIPQSAPRLGELELRPVSVESESVRYDLTLWFAEVKESLVLWWSYRDELFSAERIEWLQGRFERLLEDVVAQPESRLSQFAVESREEEAERAAREAERLAALEAGGVAELVAVDEVEGYELTAQQEQVWQRGGETWLWGAVRVAGELDVERVQRVVRELAAAEEVLRSGFARLAGMEQPLQVLRGENAVVVETFESEAALEEWGRSGQWDEEEEQWGVRLVHVGGDTVLSVRMTPLSGDQETLRCVIEEVLAGYERELLGEQSEVPRRVQYADYGAWQKEVREEEGAEGRSYWEREQQRSGEQQKELRLALEHGLLGGEWRQRRLTVASEIVEQVRRVAAAEEVSEAAVLLSAWELLLSRHTEAEEVEVESRVGGRGYEELQGALGRYERWLPVRVRVRSEARCVELLRESAVRLAEAEQWQEYFAGAGAGVGERIGFEYVTWTREWAGAELRAHWERLEERVGGQKLKLRVEGEASGLSLQLEYDDGVLSEAAAEWLSEQYVQLLAEVSGAPEQLVSDAVLVSAREQEQVLFGWNALQTFEGDVAPSVVQLFEAQAEQRPETVAVSCGGEQLSFGELNRRANQLAHYLRAQGVGPEVVVGLCVARSVEMVVGLLGILKAGGAYLPLDPNYPRPRLEYLLSDAQVQLVITQQRLLERLPVLGRVLALDQEWERIAAESEENLEPVTEAENLAYVIYTSGSTGQPKGVMISHGNLQQLLHGLQETVYAELGQEALRVGWNASLSFDASVKQWVQLLNGHSIYLLGEEERLEAERVLDYVQQYEVQVLDATPGQLRTWLEAGLREEAAGQLAAVLVGGEAIDEVLWQELGALEQPRFYNVYGPTECTVDATWSVVDGARPVLGERLPHVSVYVLDEQLRLAPVGVRGELCIGGGGVGRGYLLRAELTAERYVPHPYSTVGGERLYRTGDEGRYLADGRIEYLGRRDQQVKVRGYRIELGEIEAALESYAAVRQAVVTVREEQQLVAYLVGRAGVQFEVNEVREYARQRLPEYMMPQRWVALEQMPLTAHGKVDRERLPAPVAERAAEREAEGEWTAVEELVAGIWNEVLKQEVVGRDESFFELGGHSLLATQVISRVREVFGVEVGLRRLFEKPTLGGFSYGIEEELRAGAGVTVPPLQRLGPAEREQWGGLLPLSFAQQRLWFLHQLDPGSWFYNSFRALRLKGVLNVEALGRTLSEIVRRHEVLRTRFVNAGGEPRQQVLEAEAVPLPVTDFSDLNEAEREAAVVQATTAESREPFDLAHGPLMRVKLLRLGVEEHVVLLTMHHIVSDGWSIGLLIKEVATLYAAYSEGETSPLTELPVQYGDFAVWQRSWLQGEELERQLAYWRQRLGDRLPVLELPADRPRPPVQSYRGARLGLRLPAELSAGLKELSRREGATLFMTLLTAFQILLHRYSGQKEIVVGTDVANRNYRETEGLIGFFVNQLVLRTDMSGEPTFVELLRRVKDVCLGAYAHQDVPFEKLVEELQPERDLSRPPLFQVKLVLQNTPRESLRLGGLQLAGVGAEGVTAQFDLMLMMVEGDELSGVLEFNTDLFDERTIARFGNQFAQLLQSLVAKPDARIGMLELETEAEREQMLSGWNPPVVVSNEGSLVQVFEAQVQQRPEARALVIGEEHLSYEELNQRANQLAHYLRTQGVGPEVVVGLCLERSVEMVVGLLGILKAGGAYLPLDPAYPRQRLEYMLSDAQVGLVLTQGRLLDQLPAHWGQTIAIDDEWMTIAAESTVNPAPEHEAKNLAYVMYTSGSTGQPKGVMITHGGLLNYLQYATATYPFAAGTGTPLHSTLSFDLTVTSLYGPLLVGGWTELMSEGEGSTGLEEAWQERSGYGVVKLTPAHLRLLNAGAESAERLRAWSKGVIVGGEALSWEQVRPWVSAGVRVFNEYGPTETVVGSCVYELEAGAEERGAHGGVPIGRPIYETQMYVLDQWQQPVAVGVRGEIYVGGAGVARGYWQRAELTAERFVPHPYSAGERLYRTGDEGRYLEDGTIEYLGRRDQQVKLRGYRIELGEIEAVLESHPGVRQAVILVREEQLVGYVVAAEAERWSSEQEAGAEFRTYLRERLPEYMVPQRWVMLEQMPLTRNGKVDREALPAPSVIRVIDWEEAEATPVEELVAGIWSEVLKLNAVGRDESFFELGGHSLLATQVVSRLREVFGVEIDLRSLFEAPTVRGLSRSIEEELRAGEGLVVPPLQRVGAAERARWGGLLPLSFAQQRLWFLDQLEPESASYIIPAAVRLKGDLNVEALERTLSEIVRRHEVLRTRFVNAGGEPRQEALEAEAVSLPVTDLSGLEEAEREAAVREAATLDSHDLFDLANGPLLRVKLLRLGAEEHVVLLTMHHIVSDGWSMGLLIKEVATLYEAYSRGEESPLTELPVQYGDFAMWQQGWLQGDALERQLTYWRVQLGGTLPVLELPTHRPRPAMQSYRGGRLGLRLPEDVNAGLKELSRREGATLFMTLLTAFQILLHRYSGQKEIVVGTDVANRNYRETEGLIGFFVNQLVLRTDLSGEPTFVELLRRVKDVCLGAYAHQDVPFEKLVEELQTERDLSRSPLFQTKLVLQNQPQESLRLGELQLARVGVERVTAKFDLMLTMVEGNGLSGVLEFNTDLFDERTIERFGERYAELLRSVVAEPNARIGMLELETEAEREQKRARLAERQERGEVEGYELTAQQEQVWQRGGETWLWGAVRVAGELEVERVKRVVRELAATEEVLRSGFARLPGMERPLQVLRGESAVVVENLDSEVALEQWGRGGSWEEDQEQWGVGLVHVGQDTLLGVRMRPLCGDRETVQGVIEELLAGYERELLGMEQSEQPRRVQYADYGAWQKELREEEGAEGRSYWEREQQRGEQQLPLRLALEHGTVGGEWRQRRVVVATEIVEQVRRVAAAEEVSEEAALLSVWQLLLLPHTEAEMVPVESRINGRRYEELHDALGRYERWVPVQVQVRGEASWRELLRESAARLADAEQWQEYFPSAGAGAGAGERIGFEYVTWTREWAGAELQAQWERLDERTGGQKLKLRVENEASELSIQLECDAGVFSDAAAEWLSEQYVQLLGEVSGAPEQLLGEAVLLSAREREQVLNGWNPPVTVSNEGSVMQLFEAQVQQQPEATAIVSGGEHLSYEELNRRANQLAHYLRAQGVGPEVVVGLCLERSVEMVVGLLGILKAGGAYLPLDPAYPQQRLEYMLSDAQVGLVLTQGRLLERLQASSVRCLALDQEWERIAAESAENPPGITTATNLAYVMYTSGSTGRPKGVMITHGGLLNYLQYATATYPFAAGSGTPLHSTLSFDLTVTSLYGPLLVGGWTELMQEGEGSTGLEVAWQKRSGYGVVKLTPAHLRLLNAGAESAERLREWSKGVIVGGEALSWEQVRPWVAAGVRVFNEYGPTETVVGSCVYELKADAAERGANGGVLIGRPINETQMYVLDQWQQPVAVGVRGEIYIGGAGVARGYWQRAELTAERFVPHPYSATGGERLYRTGDEGRYLEDGTIEYLGRRDQQVKLHGYRIELGEIEAALESHGGVGQAVVLVREEQLVGYVVAVEAERWSSEREAGAALRTYLRERLPEYMVPQRWVLLEQMPLTRNGKVDREALPAPSATRVIDWTESEATPVEELVAGIWSEVLKLRAVGRHESFFELGGHSLLATQVVSRVREMFGVDVGLRCLFEAPTVSALGHAIEEQLRSGAGVTVPPLQRLEAERERWAGLLPLSFAQLRLWFLDQLEPASSFYNIPDGVRLKGELHVAALEQALNEVVRRHEVLRTRFLNAGGEPRQQVLDTEPVKLAVTNLTHLDETDQESAVREAASVESQNPFDLVNGPLLRVKLLRLGAEEHVVLLTMHHIVSDGWSMGLLIKEVATLYEAYSRGEESPLTELPVQYGDFAIWQRGWLKDEELERQLVYWRDQLGGTLPVLELPADRPRPAVQSYRGARVGLRLPAELTAALKELSRREGVTLFMTLLAAFQTLLHRYSGQQDIVVGSPVAGRNYRETEGLIGFFVNTLALRTRLSGAPTFVELLQRVKEVCLGAYAHQDVPFEKLVEELQPERDLSRSPLFQTMFVLQNAPPQDVRLAGLKLSRVAGDNATAKFDLSFVLQERGEELLGSLQYRTDLFEQPRIERMLQHFEVLLRGIVAQPEQQLWELPLLHEQELDQAVRVWNDTRRDYSHSFVHELFEAQVQQNSERVSLVCGTQQLTYGELNQRANQLAHHLRKQGVGPEVVVGLCMERSPEMVIGLLGILKAGGAYLPLDPDYPRQRLEYMLADASVKFVLTTRHLLASLPSHNAQTTLLDEDWETIALESEQNPARISNTGNLVYVIYTSGSTGQPKGVMVTHSGLSNLAAAQIESFGVRPDAKVLQFASLNFDASIFEICMTLCRGAQLHLANSEQVLVGPALSELLQQQEINVATLPPTVLKQLTDGEAFSKLETLIVAGEACGEELVEQWSAGRRFFNAYGPTETTVWATVEECRRGGGRPAIGRAIGNVEVYVLDEWLNLAPVGVSGEIYIGGAGLARGYRHRADLTAERFVPHPYSSTGGERLYRTGDEGRYLADGRIDYLGRVDHQVKVRGYRIELGEIEAALESHSGVQQAVVLVREEQQLVGYIVPANGEPEIGTELREFLRERLPEYMVPQRWVVLDQFPVTANGKIDRANLPAPDQKDSQPGRRVMAGNNLERELIKIWKNCLKIDKVGVTDNFFDLGGHSLLLVELHAKLQDHLDRKFELLELFKYPTIRSFAEFLKTQGDEAKPSETGRRVRRQPRKRFKAFAKAAGVSHHEWDVEEPGGDD